MSANNSAYMVATEYKQAPVFYDNPIVNFFLIVIISNIAMYIRMLMNDLSLY